MKLDRTEYALHTYEKCFQIRKVILGETDYYTEVTRRELAICKFSLTKGHEGREILKRFVDWIKGDSFINDIDHEQLQINILTSLFKIRIYYEPCISMCIAWNMLGG